MLPADMRVTDEAPFQRAYRRWHPYCRQLVLDAAEGAAAYDTLQRYCGAKSAVVAAAIEQALCAPYRSYHERGGKLLRPVLTCIALEALGRDPKRYASCIALVEIIHAASLMLDDVADDSPLRRGGPTAHQLVGTRVATEAGSTWINACFILLGHSSDELSHAQHAQILEEIAWEHWVTGVGVTIDTTWPWLARFDHPTKAYLQSVVHRTGSYTFRLPLKVAAIAADLAGPGMAQLVRFGEDAGLAYQLVDDILSARPADGTWGKAVAEDISQGKINLLILVALARSSRSDADRLTEILTCRTGDRRTLEEAVGIISRCGGFDAAQEVAERHVAAAREAVSQMQFLSRCGRTALDGFVDFIAHRSR